MACALITPKVLFMAHTDKGKRKWRAKNILANKKLR